MALFYLLCFCLLTKQLQTFPQVFSPWVTKMFEWLIVNHDAALLYWLCSYWFPFNSVEILCYICRCVLCFFVYACDSHTNTHFLTLTYSLLDSVMFQLNNFGILHFTSLPYLTSSYGNASIFTHLFLLFMLLSTW